MIPVASLATDAESSGKLATYYPAQVRVGDSPSFLHFQIGTLKNYCETDVSVSSKLYTWISWLTHDIPSLAGSKTMYASCRVRLLWPASSSHGYEIKVQVPSGEPFNRSYGAVFVITSSKLVAGLKGQSTNSADDVKESADDDDLILGDKLYEPYTGYSYIVAAVDDATYNLAKLNGYDQPIEHATLSKKTVHEQIITKEKLKVNP